jgi:hypothetical protein
MQNQVCRQASTRFDRWREATRRTFQTIPAPTDPASYCRLFPCAMRECVRPEVAALAGRLDRRTLRRYSEPRRRSIAMRLVMHGKPAGPGAMLHQRTETR